MKAPLSSLLGVAIGGVMASCSAGAPSTDHQGPWPIVLQRSMAQCPVPGRDAMTLLLRDQDGWRRSVGVTEDASVLGRPVDWSREVVVMHALAQQPTLGHAVRGVDATVGTEGRAIVRLQVEQPEPGALVGMAFTRPCVWLVLPRRAVEAVDLRSAKDAEWLGSAR